jgi:hypothetical protein
MLVGYGKSGVNSQANYVKLTNSVVSNKTYQWIKGEKAGDVVKSTGDTILEGNIEFLIFVDGSRCNTSLLGDMLIEVASDNPDDLLMMTNEMTPQPKVVEMPKPAPATKAPPTPVQVKPTPTTDSPLVSLLSSSKKTKEKVMITVEMELPPADLLKVVAASFDDGEKQIFNYLVNGLSHEQNEAIRKQIAETIMTTVFGKETKTTKRKNEKLQDA